MKKNLKCLLFAFSICSVFVTFAQETENEEQLQRDGIYKRSNNVGRKPIELPFVREADVALEKLIWRSIDMGQRFNQFFYYPIEVGEDAQGRISLVNAVWNAIKEGRITVYKDDEFKVVKDWSTLEKEYNKADTTFIDDIDEETGDYLGQKPVISQSEFANVANQFMRLDLKERWYIDKQRTMQMVRIVGFSLVRENRSRDPETQEEIFKGYQPIGWIRMEDEAVRELLANTEVFNEYNDAERRTYDQIFLMRRFDSFITRESNIKNRSISQYATGEEALLISEEIGKRLLDMELDLWEY